ncbi:MAG: sigma-54 dependent transcriptional regulator [Victivallaceae bacterium]|nr:sigma-54 dependent transcriptional regulator [Victivallaceae bacterium]
MAINLVLTGWGWKDYACAAAAALRKDPDAMVEGVSAHRLPEHLVEISEDSSYADVGEIWILGVGLTGDAVLLEQGLETLSSRGVKVVWLSVIEPPRPHATAKMLSLLDMHVDTSFEALTDLTARFFSVDVSDLRPIAYIKSKKEIHKQYDSLIDAAGYQYRNYQDTSYYSSAIRHLANMDPVSQWTEAEKRVVEFYRQWGGREITGDHDSIVRVRDMINRAAENPNARVIIFGESGTGKETVAQQIHNKSSRQKEPFIAFNCASVTPNLLESRFFGYKAGAFTDAKSDQDGLFKFADGGTLFLDEIGELPLEAQGVLLRVLESGKFIPCGGKEEVSVNVRVISATNRDLMEMVRQNKFRLDLFYRLNIIQIRMPSLREHIQDVPKIANGYWLKRQCRGLTQAQKEALMDYDYPGNVRELFNILERAIVLGESDLKKLISENRVMMGGGIRRPDELPELLDDVIRLHVRNVYEKYSRNVTRAAAALGVARNTVASYLKDKK